MKRFIFIRAFTWMMLCCSLTSTAQDTANLHTLPVVEIVDAPLPIAAFQSIDLAKSQDDVTAINLTEVLESFGFSMKQQHPGGLATLRNQGANSNHIDVRFAGQSLSNKMNGHFDFSLLPMELFSEVDLVNGPTAALNGSGAIGGSLILGNDPAERFNEVGFSIGSFGNYNGYVAAGYGSYRIKNQTRLAGYNLNNHYTFEINDASFERNNAESQSLGLTHITSARLSKNLGLQAEILALSSNRNLPANVYAAEDSASQSDDLLHLTVGLNHKSAFGSTSAKLKFGIQNLLYENPLFNIRAPSKTQEIGLNLSWQKAHFNISYEGSFEQGETNNYLSGSRRQFNQSLRFSAQHTIQSFSLRTHLALEHMGEELVPSMHVELGKIWAKNFHSYAFFNSHFKQPSFNDLHWLPGGNPSLKSERGWKFGGRMMVQNSNQSTQWFSDLQLHFGKLKNLIRWIPNLDRVWEAENVDASTSIGLTHQFLFAKKLGSVKFNFQNRIVATRNYNEETLGIQQAFVPKWTTNSRMNVQFNNRLQLYTQYNFISEQNTNSDGTTQIPEMHKLSFSIGKTIQLKNIDLKLLLGLKNALNKQYVYLQGFPLPGRHWNFTLRIKHKHGKYKNE